MHVLLFNLAGVAIVGWALMILVPAWSVTRRLAEWAVFPAALAVIYIVGVVPLLVAAGPGIIAEFGSADGVIRLLADPNTALVVWIHLLVFDHLVGVVIYRDNMRTRVVPLPVQSVLLFLTLMFGPAGFVTYYAIRVARGHGPAIGGTAASQA